MNKTVFREICRRLEWSRLTENLGLAAWLAVGIAICGLLSFSFARNLMIMREVSKQASKPVVLQDEIVADVIGLNQYLQALLRVEEQNRGWWLPRFGLFQSIEVEGELKAKYCKRFYDGLLLNQNERMAETVTHFSAATPQEIMGAHVAHLVRRINLLRVRLENRQLEALRARPQPSYERTLQAAGQEVIPEVGHAPNPDKRRLIGHPRRGFRLPPFSFLTSFLSTLVRSLSWCCNRLSSATFPTETTSASIAGLTFEIMTKLGCVLTTINDGFSGMCFFHQFLLFPDRRGFLLHTVTNASQAPGHQCSLRICHPLLPNRFGVSSSTRFITPIDSLGARSVGLPWVRRTASPHLVRLRKGSFLVRPPWL